MKFLTALLGAALAAAAEEGKNPIRRVVTLLQQMKSEIEAEGDKEKALYQKFDCYCSSNTSNLSEEATAAKQRINELEGQIENQTAEKERTDSELVEHKRDRASAQAAIEAAQAIRTKEHEDYLKEAGDVKENIDAINRAIPALEAGMGAKSLLQRSGGVSTLAELKKIAMTYRQIDNYEKKELLAFLSTDAVGGDYVPQSGQIVGILKQMKEQMDKDLGGIVGQEEKAAAAFANLKAAKQKEIAAASASIEAKTKRSGDLAVAIVQSQADLKDTRANLSDAEQFLVTLSQSCDDKSKEWDERQKTRSQELTAIAEAITMLNDDDALDLFNKTLPKPGKPAGFALVQTAARNPVLYRARAIIQSALQTAHHSSSLDMLAGLLSGKKVSFTKVIVMIDNMVKHLDKEQKDDDKHLDFCRTEFDAAHDNEQESKEKIASLETAQEEAETAIAQLSDEIETTQDEIKAVDKAVADATEQRQDENKEYVSTSAELTEAKELLEKVKNRLHKFYNPALYKAPTTQAPTEEERIAANVAASFVEIKAHQPSLDEAPETWNEGYKKKGQKTGGVLALMDMLLKTLNEELQQGAHDEETAQRDYEKMMASSKKQRRAAVRSVADKSEAKADLETRLVDAKNEHESSTEGLNEIQTYIAQLHTSCDFLVQNFDFRKGARATERQALLNAKAALQGAKLELAQTGNFLARN